MCPEKGYIYTMSKAGRFFVRCPGLSVPGGLIGSVTISDALRVLRVCVGLDSFDASQSDIYDVWLDGEIGIEDAMGILRSCVGIIGSFGRVGVELEFTPNRSAVSLGLNQGMVDRVKMKDQ